MRYKPGALSTQFWSPGLKLTLFCMYCAIVLSHLSGARGLSRLQLFAFCKSPNFASVFPMDGKVVLGFGNRLALALLHLSGAQGLNRWQLFAFCKSFVFLFLLLGSFPRCFAHVSTTFGGGRVRSLFLAEFHLGFFMYFHGFPAGLGLLPGSRIRGSKVPPSKKFASLRPPAEKEFSFRPVFIWFSICFPMVFCLLGLPAP